jgi:hypothetical protein
MMKILLFLRLLSFDSHKNAKPHVPKMIRDHLRGVLHIKKKTFGRHEPRSGQELLIRSGLGALRVRTAKYSVYRALRHRSEQYSTLSQSFAHFLRQANGLAHAAHIFDGRSDFLTILGICYPDRCGAAKGSVTFLSHM